MNKFAFLLSVILLVAVIPFAGMSQETKLIRHWSFDAVENHKATEQVTQQQDTIEGYFTRVKGVHGQAIRLDGFTTVIRHSAGKFLNGKPGMTVEAWVALGAYPWNWCPVITQIRETEGGFSFGIGPRGELGMSQVLGGNLIACISDKTIPLRTWTHIAATVNSGEGIRIYINGEEAGRYDSGMKPTYSANAETRIGMNYSAVFPAYRIGIEGGDQPYWFSLDGIIDEISLSDGPVPAARIKETFSNAGTIANPDLPVRQLPVIATNNRFNAYYAKLEYYPEWDDQWPVGQDPDVVVTFADSPVKYVFWRGTRYSPAWVTDNNLWMADQSVETWNGPEGCLEHMQDRHCKYSHVRIIENNDARIVVHWRYAPVSAYDKLRLADAKTGWELWVDEYYYIYPDATAIRKVTWKTDHMCKPVQFQESIPLTGEGQLQGDVIEPDYLRIANLDGQKQQFDYVENPASSPVKSIPNKPNIQQHNFKSAFDPFIIFEPGNDMDYLTDRNISNLSSPGSCNHWPVGQAYCDGSRVVAADRPTSFLGFPISDPVTHDGSDGRSWLNSIYGMKNVSVDELITLGRSWATAPELTISGASPFRSAGYDLSEKIYRVERVGASKAQRVNIRISASEKSPLFNPALIIENWGDKPVTVKSGGQTLREGTGFRQGFVSRLNGSHLVIWLNIRSTKPLQLEISAKD